MSAPYNWTPAERRIVMAMRAAGNSLQEIADQLPSRSRKAVSGFIERHGLPRAPRKVVPKPVVAPIAPEVIASGLLREAMLASLSRFANDNCVTDQEARAILLGREPSGSVARIHPSSADYTGHRPGAVVARPIGEIIRPIVAKVMEGVRAQ